MNKAIDEFEWGKPVFAGDIIQLRHIRSNKYLSVVRVSTGIKVCIASGSSLAKIVIDLEYGHTAENIPIALEESFTLKSRDGFLNIKKDSKFERQLSSILVYLTAI